MSDRKLASIQKIVDIKPIEGADKIELVFVQGWQVVCKKNEFKIGDLVVYVEIDSLMPEKPEYEFLRPRKFRVRTIKLRQQLSQGLVLPLSVVPITESTKEGEDVTEALGIVKYDPQTQEERSMIRTEKHQNKVLKFCMQSEIFRTVYFKLNSREKGEWPSCISKTDEEPIQKCAEIISENFFSDFYVTEKLDGQSFSAFTRMERVWGFNVKKFGVCSRNLQLKTPDNSKYWNSVRNYDLKRIMMKYDKPCAIQAEQTGMGIQGNKYNLPGVALYVFNLDIDGIRQGLDNMQDFCLMNGLPTVPVLNRNFIPAAHIPNNDRATIVKWLLDYSNGKSVLLDTMREGVVFRLNNAPRVSFKVRSPEFLIKHEE